MKFFAIKILVVFSLLISACSEKVIYCGENKTNPVVIRKKPEKAYKEFAKEYSTTVGTNIKYLDVLSLGDVSIDSKNQIISFREKLNQDNIKMQELLKASFFAFSQNPCEISLKEKHYALLEKLSAEKMIQSSIRTDLEKLTNSNNFSKEIGKEISRLNSNYQKNSKL